jgi:hypothetical protein
MKNIKHEVFAQKLVLATKAGWINSKACSRAGYVAEGEVAREE